MDETINAIKNFKATSHYKYLLILGGLILFWSIFNKVEMLTQSKVAILSIITIIYGVICWIRETNVNDKIDQINIELRIKLFKEPSKFSNLQGLIDKKLPKNFLENYHRGNWIIFFIWIICILVIVMI